MCIVGDVLNCWLAAGSAIVIHACVHCALGESGAKERRRDEAGNCPRKYGKERIGGKEGKNERDYGVT